MYLLMDVGNTKTKWALRDSFKIYQKGIFATEDIDQEHFENKDTIKKILVSNVAGFEKEAILKVKFKNFPCSIEFVKSTKTKGHLINQYDDPETLGTDRWLSALTIAPLLEEAVIIVSVGTAVTIDLITYDKKQFKNTFEGGVILPGIHLYKEALSQGTSNLENNKGYFDFPPLNTNDAIETGFILSVLGNIQFFYEKLKSQTSKVSLLLTGGDANVIFDHLNAELKKLTTVKEDLVLEGLYLLT